MSAIFGHSVTNESQCTEWKKGGGGGGSLRMIDLKKVTGSGRGHI